MFWRSIVIGGFCALTLNSCTTKQKEPEVVILPVISPPEVIAEHDSEQPELHREPLQLALSGSLTPHGGIGIGDSNAPVTLRLFTNYECRYCREFHRHHIPRLIQDFVLAGSLRLEVLVKALDKYPPSNLIADTIYCGGQGSGNLLALHNALTDMDTFTEQTVLEASEESGADVSNCIGSEETKHILEMQEQVANTAGINLVPTILLNGEKMIGLPEYADLKAEIEELLKG